MNDNFDPTEEWEAPKKANDLPEAPASANLKVWIDGYGVMITVRGTEVDDIVTKIEFLVKHAKDKGWKNKWDETIPTKPTVEPSRATTAPSRPLKTWCEIHGVTMKRRTSKNGKLYTSHIENGKHCFGD